MASAVRVSAQLKMFDLTPEEIEEKASEAENKEGRLTMMQLLFVNEYILDFNGAAAATRAGYARESARRTAWKLLNTPKVSMNIDRRLKERQARTEITQDKVLNEIAKMAFFNPQNLFYSDGRPKPIHELDAITAASITGIDVTRTSVNTEVIKYKIADKNASLEKLMKHLGGYEANNRTEITGKDGAPLTAPELIINIASNNNSNDNEVLGTDDGVVDEQ